MNNTWEHKPFKDVFDWCEKSNIGSRQGLSNGKYPLYIASATEIKSYDDYLVDGEALVFGTGGNPCIHYCNGKFAYTNHTEAATKKNEKISTKFYYYYFQTGWFSQLKTTFVGGGIKNSSKKKIGDLIVPVPSLHEQERIVAKIEELFAELDKSVVALKKAKEQVEVYKESILSCIFDNQANEILSKYFVVSGGLTKNSKRTTLRLIMPYIRVANVFFNKFDLQEIKTIGVTEDEARKYMLEKGDLLFVEGNGSKEQIGRVAVWNDDIKNCLHQNHIIKARSCGQLFPKYVMYYFMSKMGREQILKIASSTSGLYTLSTGKIQNLKIPVCNKKKQELIVEQIEKKLQHEQVLISNVDNCIQHADLLRQTILKKAFEGEL